MDPRISRRSLLKLGLAGGASLFIPLRFGSPLLGPASVRAQIPGGTLAPADITKYATPLLIPPVMPRAGTIPNVRGKPVDYYEISMRQFAEQVLPDGLPSTTVWGYGALSSAKKQGLLLHNAPSLTIEAMWNRPVRVKWINELVDGNGNYLPHLLPVDPTLHWANPPGGVDGRDRRPTFSATPGRYAGPVPMVTHLHGSVGVGDESDGYTEAWYLPAANDIPAGYATQGTWYDFFMGKAKTQFGVDWGSGFATFQYPNAQRASTLWYHDHALGMTRLNVYAGPAGFFIIRGGPDGDDAVIDSRFGTPAVLPGPAPHENDKFPPNKTYREIPIAIQDRAFNADGSLFYPDTRAYFDEFAGPFIPNSNVSPIWNPEFFGNAMMINGNTWPFQTVEQGRYRFRFLNGCQSRFLILDFNQIPGVEVWLIGNEGGFLPAQVNLTADNGNRLLMGLAERADVIVDFKNVPVGGHVLRNVGPDEPFAGGVPGTDFDSADPDSTGQIMEFRVVPAASPDNTTPPRFMVLPAIPPLPVEDRSRELALIELESNAHDGPSEAVLGNVVDGTATERHWADEVTENPSLNDIEIWEYYNVTADAHPMHIHEVTFEVVNRQPIAFSEEGHADITPIGQPRPPELWESGLKDTVTAYPGEVTRVKMRFGKEGQFVWHCHIVEHEDNEMMRPFRIGPEQEGQPG